MTDNLDIQYRKLSFSERDERGQLSEKSYRLISFPDGRQYLAWFWRRDIASEVCFNTLRATPTGSDIGDLNRLDAFPDIEVGDLLEPDVVRKMSGI